MNDEIPDEQLGHVLDEVVGELLAEASIHQPPVDAVRVAQRLGLVVAVDTRQSPRGRFVRLGPHRQPVIYLGANGRVERRQWAVAHELGEWAAGRVARRLGLSPADFRPAAREAMANRFAGRLLLPQAWWERLGSGCRWDLFALKRTFTTASHELIARRMLEANWPMLLTVFDQGRLYLRRSNYSAQTPPLAPCEVAVRQMLSATQRFAEAASSKLPVEFVTVRGWKIDEPPWQREIICSELAW